MAEYLISAPPRDTAASSHGELEAYVASLSFLAIACIVIGALICGVSQ